MSFSRHACRHALKPPTPSTIDHPWVSDDLLAATFRRFVNGQRRHGSCVPGPLEARRRLARRRNTALAGSGANSAEDIACLFGRNGREHMKWTDHPWQRAHTEAQGTCQSRNTLDGIDPHFWTELSSYAIGMPEVPLPFYDQHPEPAEWHHSDDRAPQSRAELWGQFMERRDWGIEDVRDYARQLEVDLHREPHYSRQIFDNLLSRSATDLTEVIRFLDDPFLNTRGSGNYLAAVEPFVRTKAKRANRVAVLNAVTRALELGLVSTEELCSIVKALPKIKVERNKSLGEWDQKALLKHYRALWTAIGRCNILGYLDLEKMLVDTWVQELLTTRNFRFAQQVVIATHDAGSGTLWPCALIMAWLKAVDSLDTMVLPSCPDKVLSLLDPDCAAKCIVDVTESLASSLGNQDRKQLLERWRECLQRVSNVAEIANSQTWLDVKAAHVPSLTPSVQHRIILRLWALRSLSRALGPMYNQDIRETDRPIYLLLNLYETNLQHTHGSFLADLMHDVQNLDLPLGNLLQLAVDLKLRKLTSKGARRTLEQLETSKTTLADVWTNPVAYNGVRTLFFGEFEQMIQQLDLTSTASAEECIRLARIGDSKSVWSILRLLGNHTPFKLCLHKAWTPLPRPDEGVLVRYHPGPRNSGCPDPYAAVDLIHQLAIAFSCCEHLTPSRSFHLIHWLYDYLRKHGGPVYPSLVRAMYHAGVVRYRREGRRVSPTQYQYIMWIMKKFEGRGVVHEITAPPQIGRSSGTMLRDD